MRSRKAAECRFPKKPKILRGMYIVDTEDSTGYFFPVQHLAAVLGKRRYQWNSGNVGVNPAPAQ